MTRDRALPFLCVVYALFLPVVGFVAVVNVAIPQMVMLVPPNVARAFGAAYIAAGIWLLVIEVRARRPIAQPYRWAFALAGGLLLSAVLGFDPLPGIAVSLFLALLPLGGNAALRTAAGGAWRPILLAFVAGGIVEAVIALGALLARTPADVYAFAHGRAMGVFENPNELALYMLALCGASAAALVDARSRALGACGLVAGVVTLVATGSRSGEVSFVIGAIVLVAGLRLGRRAVAVVALIAVVGVALAFALDRRHDPADSDSRLAAWSAGARAVALFPLTGAGIGAYYRVYPFVRSPDAPGPGHPISFDPHDFYLSVAASGGLVALGLLGAMLVSFGGETRRALREASPPARAMALSLLAGLAAMACEIVFHGPTLAFPIWTLLAALVLGIPRSGYGRVL